MSLFKRIIKSEPVRGFLCWLGAQYIRLVHVTGRWTVEGDEVPRAFWDQGKPFILAFWHGRIMMMHYSWRKGTPIHMLISQHRDGLIIARIVRRFGIETVAGSSSKGGAVALRSILKMLKNGQCIGITPDGPRGPRMRASEGVAQVARLSGVPVIPCTYSASSHRLLGSWDRFMVARPFSRGVVVWGTPLSIHTKASDEDQVAFLLQIENELNRITAYADRLMGHDPVDPAPCS